MTLRRAVFFLGRAELPLSLSSFGANGVPTWVKCLTVNKKSRFRRNDLALPLLVASEEAVTRIASVPITTSTTTGCIVLSLMIDDDDDDDDVVNVVF
jgi:hypothetical protein